MALVLADRVRETTTTIGTGAVTLDGAMIGFQPFSSGVGNANTTYYTIAGQGTSEWEVGIGTYTSASNTLSRDTVLSSSNGGALVNFSAGQKDIWVDYAANKAVTTDTLAYPPAIGGTTPAAGTFTTLTSNSTAQFGRGSANYIQAVGSATGISPEMSALGSDTNIAFTIESKGTGAVNLAAGSRGVNISNGGTVTALTQTAGGSYTSVPTVAITAPTTAGGVQATATVNVQATSSTTIAFGGTGYTVNDVLTVVGGTGTASQITVATVSAGVITGITISTAGNYSATASNPVSVTGGTGSGATFNMVYTMRSGTFTITNAGSGYVEQPTVSFSGGGGSGAAAYATVGAGTVIRALGSTGTQSLDFHTPASASNTVPALRLRDVSVGTSNTGFVQVQNANGYAQVMAQGPANAGLFIASNGTGEIRLNTQSTAEVNQMRVTHTASAVNYVQVTGAATGGRPTVSSQGSDTNIDLALTPKGTGNVRFGTYTGTALSIAGYIEIKDAGGTIRKLAVVA